MGKLNKLNIVPPLCVISLAMLTTVPATVSAESKVSYIPDKENVETIILENETVKYTISLVQGVELSSVIKKGEGTDFLDGNPPLMFCSVRSARDVGYQLLTLGEKERRADEVSISVTEKSSYAENLLVVTQTFSLGTGPELSWNIKVTNTSTAGIGYRSALTVPSRITFPVMQKIGLGGESDMHYLIPTGGSFFCIDSPRDFIFYFTRASDPLMPIDIFNTRLKRGIYFHILRSKLDWAFADKDDFKSKIFRMVHEPGDQTEILHCRICPHRGDWHAAFGAFKKHIRSSFDFTYYKRPVQKKYRQRFVSHFTFLYGHDIYDPENNRFRIDKFLEEGELNFGGYDYMLLWHDYPRTGLDRRDQFAMYEDLPGGLEGLRRMVERAHARGVQVFIPFKPWDIIGARKDPFAEEARIAMAIRADGIFLDTMSESDRAFRHALDAVNPEVVFVSEGRPDLEGAQLVTGSWNQNGRASNRMPNVDLLRFVLPEHNVRNINRSARKRDELILNALFNGVGLIVWEDIFGEINRFTWQERILIKRYSRIIHENQDAYLTLEPIPLVDDFHENLYLNAFPARDKCVYPAYQLGRENVGRWEHRRLIGPFMEVDHPEDWHYVDLWNHQPIHAEKVGSRTRLSFLEEPADVMSCIVGFPENLLIERDGDILRIEVTNPLDNTSIQINTVDNLTLLEEEALKIEGTRGTVRISQLELDFPYLVLVKLMQGSLLKDEVILNLGWKKFDE